MDEIRISNSGDNPTQYFYKHYKPMDVEYAGANIVSIINIIQPDMTPAEAIECFYQCEKELLDLNPDKKVINICVTSNNILINFGDK